MTEKQAIHCMKFNCELAVCEECDLYGTVGTDHCFEDACREAINALEKQIPKKVIFVHPLQKDDNGDYMCPSCKSGTVYDAYGNRSPYCHYCGQALEWK